MKYTVALLFLVGFIAFIGAVPVEEDTQDQSVADTEKETSPPVSEEPEEDENEDVEDELVNGDKEEDEDEEKPENELADAEDPTSGYRRAHQHRFQKVLQQIKHRGFLKRYKCRVLRFRKVCVRRKFHKCTKFIFLKTWRCFKDVPFTCKETCPRRVLRRCVKRVCIRCLRTRRCKTVRTLCFFYAGCKRVCK